MKPDSKPKTWLTALDRKVMSVNRFMDRVAYWPNKPPTEEELTKTSDDRLKRKETRKTLAKQRGNHSAVISTLKRVLRRAIFLYIYHKMIKSFFLTFLVVILYSLRVDSPDFQR